MSTTNKTNLLSTIHVQLEGMLKFVQNLFSTVFPSWPVMKIDSFCIRTSKCLHTLPAVKKPRHFYVPHYEPD